MTSRMMYAILMLVMDMAFSDVVRPRAGDRKAAVVLCRRIEVNGGTAELSHPRMAWTVGGSGFRVARGVSVGDPDFALEEGVAPFGEPRRAAAWC